VGEQPFRFILSTPPGSGDKKTLPVSFFSPPRTVRQRACEGAKQFRRKRDAELREAQRNVLSVRVLRFVTILAVGEGPPLARRIDAPAVRVRAQPGTALERTPCGECLFIRTIWQTLSQRLLRTRAVHLERLADAFSSHTSALLTVISVEAQIANVKSRTVPPASTYAQSHAPRQRISITDLVIWSSHSGLVSGGS